MPDFLHRPLFQKKLSFGQAGLYKLDAAFIFIYAAVWFVFGPDVSEISSNQPQISVSGHDFTKLGRFGLYSIRISTFVAIARDNRQPQLLEWWITIIGFSFAVFMIVFGGFFELPYVSAHGYKFCCDSRDAGVYVKTSLPCPSPPPANGN